MNEIGDGGEIPGQTTSTYQKELQTNIERFQNALDGYQVASNADERTRLQSLMTQNMDLIQNSIREIKRSGIEKQGQVVQSDYEHYRQSPSNESLTALQQDLGTLKEYSKLPQA